MGPSLSTTPVGAIAAALGVGLFTFVLWTIVHQYVKMLRTRGIPPGPRPWPILGNMGSVPASTVRLEEWCFKQAKRYGGVFSFWIGGQLVVYVGSYKAIKEVLVTKDKEFASRPPMPERISRTLHPRSIFASGYGDYWRKTRRLAILHLLSTKAVKSKSSIRDDEIAIMIENLKRESEKNHGIFEPRDQILRANLNTMMRPLFGIRFPSPHEAAFLEKREALYQSMQASFRQMAGFDWSSVMPMLGPLLNRDVKGTTAFRDGELAVLIEEHRTARERAGAGFVAEDVVDTLLAISETEGLSPNDLLSILVDFLNASVDTSRVSIEWTLGELARRPEIRQRLQTELDTVVGRDRPVQEDDIEKLPYLRAVIKEHFRSRSIGPFLGPHMNDLETTIVGFRIPAKTHIVTHSRGLSRDPAFFDRAGEFLPERFLAEDVDITGKDIRVAPFGAGRRGCPGILQALTVVQLAVARVCQAFDFVSIEGSDVDMEERDWGL